MIHLGVHFLNAFKRLSPLPTLAVTARAAKLKAEGKDIIGLGAGEPDFDTPLHIADAGVEAIRNGITRYTAVDGTAELKDAIIGKFKRENALSYERSQILVSSGAKQTCFNRLRSRSWIRAMSASFRHRTGSPIRTWRLLADGVPVTVYAGADQGYKITPAQLAAAITPRTKLLILNSPSNPTGAAYTKAELQALGAVLAEHPQIVIAADEMYEHIYWARGTLQSFAQANPQLYDAHRHHQRRLEGLCDDRLAHRLLRRTEGNRRGDERPSRASRLRMPRASRSAPRPSR